VTRIWQAFVLALTLGFTALPGAHPPGLILDTPFNSLSAVRKNMIRIIQDCPRVDREFQTESPALAGSVRQYQSLSTVRLIVLRLRFQQF
jgi:hypothetical protein